MKINRCGQSDNVWTVHRKFLRNKNQPDAISFLIYSINYPQHVSNRLTIHPQEADYITCSLWHLTCIHVDWMLTRSRWKFRTDRVSMQSAWMHAQCHRLHVQ